MSKILIIDDDDSVREELSERIRAMGLESEEADSLNAALKMLDEYVFDCVLLDLCIPIKFEGIARLEHGKHLLQRILSENGAPPVIIITAHRLRRSAGSAPIKLRDEFRILHGDYEINMEAHHPGTGAFFQSGKIQGLVGTGNKTHLSFQTIRFEGKSLHEPTPPTSPASATMSSVADSSRNSYENSTVRILCCQLINTRV